MVISSEENSVVEHYARFVGVKELLVEDIEEESPSQAEYSNVSSNHPAFKELYLQVRVVQQKYKAKFVPNSVTEAAFNDGQSPYKYNDLWLENVKKEFKRVNKALVNFMETKDGSVSNNQEEKFIAIAAEEITKLVGRITLESGQVTKSIDETFKRLQSLGGINPNQSQVYSNLQQQLMAVIDEKIPAMISSLTGLVGDDNQGYVKKTNQEFSVFENQEKTRLYELVQLIAEKTSFSQAAHPGRPAAPRGESIHLKKVDPPKFSGEEVEFPEFHRKWLAVVGPANLPDEAEVDRLRDALPKDTREMLTGVTKVSKAWDILNKRFGDKDLIATKLKNELKGLTLKEKADHEKIIALSIKIRSLVTRLESLQASNALKYDGEFVSAVYFQLPDRQKSKWLDFDKSLHPDKWSAMLAFLDDAYEKAVQEKLLLASYTPSAPAVKKVATAGFLAATVEEGGEGAVGGGGDGSGTSKKEQAKQKLEQVRKKVGKCPVCKQEHTFKSKWRPIPWPSDRFIQCKKFNDMTSRQRAETLEKFGGCARCTAWGHKKADCYLNMVDCSELVNGSRCHKDHSRLVCNSGVAYCLAARSSGESSFADIDELQATLHYTQDIPVNKGENARVLWDDGSNRVLVNNDFAKENNLKSRDATVTMKVVGDVKKMEVKIYELDLGDMYGKQHHVWGYGIDNIIDPDEPVELSQVRSLFPHVPDQAFSSLPKKRIDLLIGLNYNSLHPNGGTGVDTVGNLKALRSRFGCGWVIGGCHKDLKTSPLKFSSQAASARIARVSIVPEVSFTELDFSEQICSEYQPTVFPPCSGFEETANIAKVSVDPVLTPEFWETDGMGVLPPRKCSKCRQCAERGDCSESHYLLTLKEEAELKLITDNTTIRDGEVYVEYPFIKDPSCLPNNRGVAVKVADRLWTSLKKDGLLEPYHEEMRKYIERGTFVKLSKEELSSYEGPQQYITHHGVLKDSVTTPLRVVTNSSFNNHGHSLNSCLPKGPNSLNDMNQITLRFRCHEEAFLYDLSKAYNTMRTGIVEKHLRRFVWRFSEEEDWQDYGIDRVHFGDISAACFLEVSKKKVANLGRDIDNMAVEKIIQDTYVDDGVTGGKAEDVRRMVGSRDADGNYTGTISQILAKGNFKVKEFVVLGDQDQADENLLGNTVFGYDLDPKKCTLSVKFAMNLSRKKRNVRIKPNLTLADVDSLKDIKMTKRLLLGVTNSFGDFLGMASPFTIKMKLNMKKLFELDHPLGWDDDIPPGLRESWINLIVEALIADRLTFPRSTRPDNAVGGPVIVGFGDGAFAAFAAAVYLVWRIACEHGIDCEGHFQSALLCAKAKVTPLRGFTIPRSELSGGVLASRLMLTVAIALSRLDDRPTSSILLLDSTCTISCLEENAKKLKPFFHNRRAELLDNMDEVRQYCPMEEVHHVSGKLNPADIPTRGDTALEDIGPSSLWQAGPSFLCSPREQWPVTREFVRVAIPDQEKRQPGTMATATFRAVVIKQRKLQADNSILPVQHKVLASFLKQNNDLESRKRVLSLVLRGWKLGKTVENLTPPPSAEELLYSEKLILAHGMLETAQAFLSGQLASLLPERQGPLIVTRGRLGEKSLERLLGVSALPILMPSSRVAELFMWRAHEGYSGMFHRSVAQTLAKSRSSVWIIKGKDLAKKVCWECMVCRKNRKVLAKQQMALFREESLQVCPPWTNISLDFAGPVTIKGEVNSRSRGKSWILIYVCRNTKAVCLLATSGYSTADFLCKHDEFVARKNRPRTIVSDRGTQLVRAGIVLAEKEKPGNWKWSDVVRQNSATNWEFVPVGSQHRNGLSEAQVKILKKSLNLAMVPGTVLKYSELVTLLAKIAHCVNSRPIGLSSTSQDSQQDDFLSPITPNQLLLGKTDDDAPPLDYDDSDKLTARLAFVSSVYDAWWRAWYKQVLPTLVPCKKWKKEERNLEVGDVVNMYYPSSVKDDYRLARVCETFPDEKGLVRTVRVCYRKRDKRESRTEYKAKPLTEELVSVQRLSVLLPASEQSSSTSTSVNLLLNS